MDDADLDPFAPPPALDPGLPRRAETPPGVPRITVPVPATLPPARAADDDLDPYAAPTSAQPQQGAPNKTFGELQPADPDWTQSAKWLAGDVLRNAGAQPYPAQHLGDAAVDIGSSFTPLGSVLALGDAAYNLKRGNYGKAAINAIGALPLISQGRKIYRAMHGMPTVPQIIPAHTPPTGGWSTVGAPALQDAPRALGGESALTRGFVTPSVDELVGRGARMNEPVGAAQRAYNAINNSPVRYTAQVGDDIAALAKAHIQHPNIGAFTPQKAPLVHSTLDDFAQAWRARGTPVTPADLDTLRQGLRGLPDANGPAGNRAVDMLDRYMFSPPWWQVLRGSPQEFNTMRRQFEVARGNYRSGQTAKEVVDAIDRGGIGAGATHSGMNVDNQTRQQLAALIKTPAGREKIFGATRPEMTGIWEVSQGDKAANRLRYYGNLLGGGGGLGQLVGGGAGATAGAFVSHAFGFPPWMGVPAAFIGKELPTVAGSALKTASNERTVNAATEMAQRIARNSPEYNRRLAAATARGTGSMDNPMIRARDAITSALLPNPEVRKWLEDKWSNLSVPYANRR